MQARFFILSLSFALSLFLSACGGQPKEKFSTEEKDAQQEAFQSMMDIHDSAMGMIAEMNRVGRELKPYRESLQDEALIEEVGLAVERLEGAEEAMMEWMANSPKLGKMRDTLNHDQVIAMLNAEEEKINDVGNAMTSSLENAKALLTRLQELKSE